jgi:P2 family phage contractile tail tube protein
MSNWVRKYQGLYIDSIQKVGSMIEYTAPVLEIITEDFRAGGMDAAVPMDMGMNPLTASFTAGEDADMLARFGIKDGSKVPVFIRSHLEDEVTGATKTVIEELRGLLTKVDHGTKTSGAFQATTFEMKLFYYRYEADGSNVHEIDPVNMVRLINGTDQLVEARAALGL